MGGDARARGTLLVVLNWNDHDVTRGLLERLEDEPRPVVLVDNGSTDGSGARLHASFPRHAYVANPKNLGFTGGMNAGIREAVSRGFDHVLLLNNDLRPEPGMIAEMERVMTADPEIGVVGAVIHRGAVDGPVDHAAETLDRWTLGLGRREVSLDGADPVAADWVSGAAFMIRCRVVEELGYLEDDFFIYWEEVDFCCRARAAGWRVVVAPGARAVHDDKGLDASNAIPLYLLWRNRWIFMRRNLGLAQRFVAGAWTLAGALRDVLGRTLRGKGGAWIPILGNLHGLLGCRGDRHLARLRERARRNPIRP